MILITGASKGVGKYLFDYYMSKKEDVFGTYNSTILHSKNGRYTKIDISNYQDVENWINSLPLKKEITLINCAGITYNAFTHKSDPDSWKNVIDVNLMGVYFAIRAILPYMRENKYGRIINFSSVAAQKGTPGVSAYAASKSALWGLSKTIAIENASLGITINNINLGYSELGMIEAVPEKFKEQIKSQIPGGEFCTKENIVNCVEFLRQNSYTNGSSVDLNGGIY